VPAFEPAATDFTGFEIYTIEYDDEDIYGSVSYRQRTNSKVSSAPKKLRFPAPKKPQSKQLTSSSSSSSPSKIPMPSKYVPMSEDGQASDYYRYYNMYKDLGNGTYIAAKMNYDGTFQVDTEMSTRYYSAYGV
jgi:hypothetical protein